MVTDHYVPAMDSGSQKIVQIARDWVREQGIANFYTPENAVEAFSFLCRYRRNRAQLMEVPLAREADEPAPDLKKAAAIFDEAVKQDRTLLTEHEAKALLGAFVHE